jgi:hypothetical protein
MSPNAQIGTALLAFGLICVTVTIIGIRRREKTGGLGRVPPLDPAHRGQIIAMKDEDYDLVIRGGAWVNGVNVTWPFASLLIGPTQAELRVYAVEPIQIARTEVIGLRWVHGPLGKGIKFQTESGRLNKVTVWPLGKAKKPLDDLGWR